MANWIEIKDTLINLDKLTDICEYFDDDSYQIVFYIGGSSTRIEYNSEEERNFAFGQVKKAVNPITMNRLKEGQSE
jgi:hypothetical protein